MEPLRKQLRLNEVTGVWPWLNRICVLMKRDTRVFTPSVSFPHPVCAYMLCSFSFVQLFVTLWPKPRQATMHQERPGTMTLESRLWICEKMGAIWVTQSAVFCYGCKSWLITFQKTDKSTSFRDKRFGLYRRGVERDLEVETYLERQAIGGCFSWGSWWWWWDFLSSGRQQRELDI